MFGRKKKEPAPPPVPKYALFVRCLGDTYEYKLNITENKAEVDAIKQKLDENFTKSRVVVIGKRTLVLDKIISYRVDRYFRRTFRM